MARRAPSNIRPQKEASRKPVREAKGATPLSSQAELVCAAAVFLVALVVYSWTLAPTVTLTDSGELIVAAYGLGVAHPPGFPLWVVLAHVASLVPVGSVAVRINFSSAVFAALACGTLTLVVTELFVTASCFVVSRRKNKGAQHGSNTRNRSVNGVLMFAPGVGAGLLMAFSRTLSAYATITEVYALNTLLILLVFFFGCSMAPRDH
ncbi:MAG: DUF2723 domain-containing protein [Candidatus Udaeobacter sp.]